MKLLMATICILGLIILMGVIGQQDYESELESHRVYCENVRDNVWPDYDNRGCEE